MTTALLVLFAAAFDGTIAVEVPALTARDLDSASGAAAVAAALGSHGILRISGVAGLGSTNALALRELMECGSDSQDGFHRKAMMDGSQRWTLAAFAHKDAVPEAVRARCGGLEESLAPLRGVLGDLGEQVVRSMAPAFGLNGPALRHGGIPALFAQGKQLEHFHLYNTANASSQELAVPFHVDSGAFLLLTKSLVFQAGQPLPEDPDTGLVFETGAAAKLADDDALLLAGDALRSFLGAQVAVRRHGVSLAGLATDSFRAWHGRMYLFPDDSVSDQNKTAKSLFLAPLESEKSHPWILDMQEQCDTQIETCWMSITQCVKMCPDGKTLQQCLLPSREYGICSLENGEPNPKAMNPECAWRCPEGADDKPNGFCDDSVHIDMYMSGFTSMYNQHRPCVVLLFQGAKLDSPLKFAVGMLVVIIMGVCTQGLLAIRPFVGRKTGNNRFVEALMFGLQVSFGWFMMLVAMTFSTELFICATSGLILGHLLFNGRADSKEVLGSPCCNAVNGANTKVAATSTGAQLADARRPLLAGETRATLALEGMTCGSCVATISNTLRSIPGVSEAAVDLATQRAEVLYREPATPKQLVDAVEDVGFGAALQ